MMVSIYRRDVDISGLGMVLRGDKVWLVKGDSFDCGVEGVPFFSSHTLPPRSFIWSP